MLIRKRMQPISPMNRGEVNLLKRVCVHVHTYVAPYLVHVTLCMYVYMCFYIHVYTSASIEGNTCIHMYCKGVL